MHLTDFIVGAIFAFSGITAGLGAAVLALVPTKSNMRVVRFLFWAAAFSFGSLGIVWSATSHGHSIVVQMLVSAVFAAIAAAGLTWVLWQIRSAEQPAFLIERPATITPKMETTNNFEMKPYVSSSHREMLSNSMDKIEIILESKAKTTATIADDLFNSWRDWPKRYGMNMSSPQSDEKLANSIAELTEEVRNSLFEGVLGNVDILPVKAEVAAVLGSEEPLLDLHSAALTFARGLSGLKENPTNPGIIEVLNAHNSTFYAIGNRYRAWVDSCLERARIQRSK